MPDEIGQYIAKKRKEKKLTQEQLAEILNVSVQAISKWETGIHVPDITRLREICDCLGVSADEVMRARDNFEIENNIYMCKRVLVKIYKSLIKVVLAACVLLFVIFLCGIGNKINKQVKDTNYSRTHYRRITNELYKEDVVDIAIMDKDNNILVSTTIDSNSKELKERDLKLVIKYDNKETKNLYIPIK